MISNCWRLVYSFSLSLSLSLSHTHTHTELPAGINNNSDLLMETLKMETSIKGNNGTAKGTF
jgi:hypothetical protein